MTDPSSASPPVGSVPLTTEGGAHEFTQLAELCEALARRLGDWSTAGTDPSSAGTMSSLSARLAEHAEWWRDRIPESELLQGTREEASDPPRLDALLAMLDVAVAAGTGADPAQDHEGSGAMVPALADVGALGLLADCVEPLGAD